MVVSPYWTGINVEESSKNLIMFKMNLLYWSFCFLVVFNACEDDLHDKNTVQYSDFTLEDINPKSNSYGQSIGLSYFNGQVSSYYFGDQG